MVEQNDGDEWYVVGVFATGEAADRAIEAKEFPDCGDFDPDTDQCPLSITQWTVR